MANILPALAQSRRPRGVVRINGEAIGGWLSWSCTSNTFYEADTFRVTFALSGLPTQTAQPFIEQKELFVELLAGFPADPDRPTAAEMVSQVYGRVDEIEFDPVGRTLNLTGRDLTGAFIDARIVKEWSNAKASDIASALAASHGLVPVVTATSVDVGTYYKRDQVRLQANQSEWDLLAWLAREAGFVCFVAGQELHFEPPAAGSADPYIVQWQDNPFMANVQELRFSRALTVAKGITVTVRAASLKSKTAVVATYPGAAKALQAGKASPFGNTQNYYFTLPAGSTPAQCEAHAVAKYREIIAHEMRMHARLPADNVLTAKRPVRVQGTGTSFDQIYYPTSVSRMMNMDEGYTMNVEARNSLMAGPL